jgi:hypothetical protein
MLISQMTENFCKLNRQQKNMRITSMNCSTREGKAERENDREGKRGTMNTRKNKGNKLQKWKLGEQNKEINK